MDEEQGKEGAGEGCSGGERGICVEERAASFRAGGWKDGLPPASNARFALGVLAGVQRGLAGDVLQDQGGGQSVGARWCL